VADGFSGRVFAWSGGYPYGDDDPWYREQEPAPPPPAKKGEKPAKEPAEPPKDPPEDPNGREGGRGGTPTRGLACGRFMPLHTGHEHYIHFARTWVDELTVLLFTYPGDAIAGELREAWLREAFPSVNVIRAQVEAPGRDDPDFWLRWANILRGLLLEAPDYFFSGDRRASRIASHLGARHVLVDAKRDAVPISATRIRERPLAHWRFLPACVRPHYVRRVALLGPESTGKSTLARRLADHFETVFVPEYARQRAESLRRPFAYDDVETIGRSQIAAEASLARTANRVLFADTDARSLRMWSERLFDRCPARVAEAARTSRWHLTLVTAPDVPFVGDAAFDQPEMRRAFFERAVSEARATSDRVVVVRGTWDERWDAARAAVEAELAE
jgi:HTH-type transcriptional repressor of NAD biosynthesis genes